MLSHAGVSATGNRCSSDLDVARPLATAGRKRLSAAVLSAWPISGLSSSALPTAKAVRGGSREKLRAFLCVEQELNRHTRLTWPTGMGWATTATGKVPPGHQPSSKVVTPKTRSCAMTGGGPRYIRAQPKTSIIRCCATNAMAAGLFSGASRNSGPPVANPARCA